MSGLFAYLTHRPKLIIVLIVSALGLLPVAIWLDLRNISDKALQAQASELNAMMSTVRSYYSRNVVGRVVASDGRTQPSHKYAEIPGAIPIPATLSLELSELVGDRRATISYRFISDLPFIDRPQHQMDAFEVKALANFRAQPQPASSPVIDTDGTIFNRRIRYAAPVLMGGACVSCHNSHPESPKHDWKVGDVRGLQELTIHQPIAANVFSFKYLLLYFVGAGVFATTFAALQWRQTKMIGRMNQELEAANDFLSGISVKLARYLSPQIYRSIFKGEKDVLISTERKKLTIFFSDIKDFTETTERLQPEDLTAVLNQYLTEMTAIALAHGATVDKYIGDAILVFFGDPETKGVEEDAKACLYMAIAMQKRMRALNAEWRQRGIEVPFRIRCGMNTGYCNVGNFGSDERMDYTIVGAQVNLAARLESIAEPGNIVLSYETYALVRDIIHAREMAPIQMKGIARDVVPYTVEGLREDPEAKSAVISEHAKGVDLYLDIENIDAPAAARLSAKLQLALDRLNEQAGAEGTRR
ncbi:MAG: adenylate/guanylate cyclase domain-containing protein [Kiloniellales bacterium]